MKRGSLIIYDNSGSVWVNTGDAEGDVLPHTLPEGLPYIITEFGELDGKIVQRVDVKSKSLIIENIAHELTDEDIEIKRLQQELLDVQEQLVNLEYEKILN